MAIPTVAKGSSLYTTWSLYRPVSGGGTPSELVDPDEYPSGPRFEVRDSGNAVVPGLDALPFKMRRGRGVFSLEIPIPLSGGVLPAGETFTVQLKAGTASANGQALVGRSGVPPALEFSVIDGATVYDPEQFYVDPAELESVYGVSPRPEEHEVRFAQRLVDDWMHRSLWPSMFERERYSVPPDRNLIVLHHRPVIRLYSAALSDPVAAQGGMGRYGYGRRDKRSMNQTGPANYMSVMAVLGSPPQWVAMDTAQVEFHPQTGECWLPSGFFLLNYTQVEMTYEAGFAAIPRRAKGAIAETVAWVRLKGFGPLMGWSVGRVSHNTNTDDLLTPQVKRALEPYRAKYNV